MPQMTGTFVAPIGILLLAACLIAMITRRLGLPYIVGLVIGGFLIALLPSSPDLPLSRELIFNVLLPPLVFEAALQLNWRRFRDELALTLTLAFLGVAIAGTVVAAGMHYGVGWSWIGAALFGALIAATDPVSVISAFREMRAEKRLSMVVESESLLNDGAAAAGFAVLLAIAGGVSDGPVASTIAFLWATGGGVLTGLAISGLAILIAGRTDDHLIQITLTTVVAYASFLVAEHFHASGIIAALTAGLTIGRFSKNVFPDEEGPLVRSIWEYIAFLANSLIFILIGMNEANQPLREFVSLAALGAIALVLLGRAISIYPLAFMFSRSRWRLPMPYQHVLFWGGLKGALALALALAVPASVPERNTIIIAAFLVVAFSILVQGLTMPRLLKWYDLREPHEGSSR
jgi:CPA1 family monovalent cation:H+ antiporter